MFLDSAEMDVQLVEVLQERAERRAFRHFCKGIDILRETLAAVAELTIRTGDISVRVVDVPGEKNAGVDLTPVGSHLLAVLAAGIEIRHFVCAEDIVHVLGQLCLQRGHDGEFLTDKDLGQQLLRAGEYHRLLIEVLDERAFGQELRHVANLVSCLFGEALTGARQNGRADENRYIRQIGDELFHECQILRTVFFRRHMNLQKSNVNVTQVIIVALVGVADE